MSTTTSAGTISATLPATGRTLLGDITASTIWGDNSLQYYLGNNTTLGFDTEFATAFGQLYGGTPDANFAFTNQTVRAFEMFDSIVTNDFTRVTDAATAQTTADLVLVTASGTPAIPGLEGFDQFPGSSTRGTNDSWSIGAFSTNLGVLTATPERGGGEYLNWTLLHEIGHSMGLFHTHQEVAGQPALTSVGTDMNNERYSVMSYVGATSGATTYGHAVGLMALDIAALQELYGAETYANTNSTYTLFDRTSADLQLNEGDVHIGRAYFSIWDSGGTDMIDYGSSANSVMINLNAATLDRSATAADAAPAVTAAQHTTFFSNLSASLRDEMTDADNNAGGFFSRVLLQSGTTYNGEDGGFTIANGAVIENATGGAQEDLLIGNEVNNTLTGNAGDDVLIGSGGADSLDGGAGTADVAGYSGARSEYTITSTSMGQYTVAHTGGTMVDGTDTLTDVEFARFSDQRLDLSTIGVTPPTSGISLLSGLGGTAGFGEGELARNDDGSTALIDFTSIFADGLNFFGSVFTGMYVNNNGSITFNAPRSTFTPTAITEVSNNPEISPYFADVDTRGGVTTASPGGNSTGSNLVYWDFNTTTDQIIVTWDDVGYFSNQINLTNAFQLILTDRGMGDFDIEFRYEDVNWTTGGASGGTNGLGGTIARAGYTAGTGVPDAFFELPTSGDQGAMLGLDETAGNTGDVGRWLFNVRNGGVVTSNIPDLPDVWMGGWTTGDPHLQTLDGVGYDFQAAGEYVLLRGTGTSTFEIQARMAPAGNNVSVNEAISTRVGTDIVMIDATDTEPVMINGVATAITNFGSLAVNGGEIFREDNTYTIVYSGADGTVNNGDSRVIVDVLSNRIDIDVRLNAELLGNLEGLLGDGDGNAANDVARADGTVLARPFVFSDIYGGYRDDWRVSTDTQSLFTYDAGESLEGFYLESYPTNLISLADLDPAVVAAATQAALNAGLVQGTANFNNAVLDFALTQDTSFITSAAGVPTGAGAAVVEVNADPTVDLTGTTGVDTLVAGLGNDTIHALDGNDSLDGAFGNDILFGEGGDDIINGGAGSDRLIGDTGNDTLNGGGGSDTLNGGDGDDFIFGGDSSRDLRDLVFAGAGNDSVDSGYGNDEVFGQGGNDTIAGGFGSDTLQGQDGNDVLTGSALSDLVFGNAGDDFVNGGFGHDRINGGTGADRFFHLGIFDHGSDFIQDYNAAEGDRLLFGQAGATRSQFQININDAVAPDGEKAGDDNVQEAFVIYRPTGQIMWALIDGAGQSSINLQLGGEVFDLLA
jgi:Ca2+-binding RTX toxin-like protein